MAHKSMTIDEVKKRRIKLESDILDLMKSFETDTKIRVGYINVQRKERGIHDECPTIEKFKPGPLKNVDVSIDFDIID